jgi:predicted MFS family arabinose efflux permease
VSFASISSTTHRPLTRLDLTVLCFASAVGVGTIYFPQALIPAVAADMHVSEQRAAWIASAPQLGYAIGIVLIVPLGDVLSPRRLLRCLFAGSAAASVVAALAPSLPVLVAASVGMGCLTVAAPVIGPWAASRTDVRRLGWLSGLLLSCCIAGMISARAGAGVLGDTGWWRAAYGIAGVAALACVPLVGRRQPDPTRDRLRVTAGYLARPLRAVRAQAELRRSMAYQSCLFAAFTATWTTLVLVLRDQFGLSADALGVISLVALVTMAGTPWAGRYADRVGPDRLNTVTMVGGLVAASLLAAGMLGGAIGLALLIAGVCVLDVAMQSGMVANVTRMYRLDTESRSAMNAAYMGCAFVSGAVGSWLGVWLYQTYGWGAVAAFVAALSMAALARHRARAATPERPQEVSCPS